jgi:hypothetical protein
VRPGAGLRPASAAGTAPVGQPRCGGPCPAAGLHCAGPLHERPTGTGSSRRPVAACRPASPGLVCDKSPLPSPHPSVPLSRRCVELPGGDAAQRAGVQAGAGAAGCARTGGRGGGQCIGARPAQRHQLRCAGAGPGGQLPHACAAGGPAAAAGGPQAPAGAAPAAAGAAPAAGAPAAGAPAAAGADPAAGRGRRPGPGPQLPPGRQVRGLAQPLPVHRLLRMHSTARACAAVCRAPALLQGALLHACS